MSLKSVALFAVVLLGLYLSDGYCFAQKVYSSELYGNYSLERRRVRELQSGKPFVLQVNRKNTRYIINQLFDLNGRTIRIPKNSVLVFGEGGGLKNGALIGDYAIDAPPCKVFDNIDLISFSTHGLDYRWFAGEDKKVSSRTLNNLPPVPVFFGEESYYSIEPIDLSGIDYIEYHDLKLSFSKSIKAYCRTIAGGLGSIKQTEVRNKCEFDSPHSVRLSKVMTKDFLGKIICIRTADRTLQDWRPLSADSDYNVKGNPSLFKGLTSIVSRIDGDVVGLLDSLDSFSSCRSYSYQDGETMITNKPIYSTWAICQPKHLKLYNCVFTGTERYASVYIGGNDIVIEGCSFVSLKGTEAVLSINNSHGGYIHNCTIEGAWAGGNNGTNYGIQVNCSTAITIDDCTFRDNRRGVDFSGEYESRYCTVSNCTVIGNDYKYHSGSGFGGHSTSFGNTFSNNYLEGMFQVGIQCRGECEVVEGNTINAFCNGAIFVTSFNTTVRNNVAHTSKWGRNHTAFHIGNDYGFESTVTIEGNDVDVRERFLHAYDPRFTTLEVRNNRVHCFVDSPSSVVRIALNGFSGVFSGNEIEVVGNRKNVIGIPDSEEMFNKVH